MSSSFSAVANATNSCLDHGTFVAVQVTSGAFAALGCVPCIVCIVAILVAKKYTQCFMRLVLYLFILSLLSSIIGGLDAIVLSLGSQGTQRNDCQAFGFLANYLAYCRSCLTCAICTDALVFSRYRRQLQSLRLEAAVVLLTTLLVPTMLSWEYFYRPEGTSWCVTGVYVSTKDGYCSSLVLPLPGMGLGIGLATAPHVVLYALSVAMAAYVTCLVCSRNAVGAVGVPFALLKRNQMSTCPMLLYSTLLCFDYIAALVIRATVKDPSTDLYTYAVGIAVVTALYHSSNVFYPLMLYRDQSELLSTVKSGWRARDGSVSDGRTMGSSNSCRSDSIDSSASCSGRSFTFFAEKPYLEEINGAHERSLLCKNVDKKRPSIFAV